MGLFDNANVVMINNKQVQSIITSDGGVLYEKSNYTSLSINVPMTIISTDAFNIYGDLKDSNNDGISGETVSLYVNGRMVDSTTTSNNGEYSFTYTAHFGDYKYQVRYAGSSSYGESMSSVVIRMIRRDTTVLSVTSPVDNVLVRDGNINIEGSLADDDGDVLDGKTINIGVEIKND